MPICYILVALFLFILTNAAHTTKPSFFQSCPPTRCGSIPIRYPFRLQSADPSCGVLLLTCSNHIPHVQINSTSLQVTNIDYQNSSLSARIGPAFGSLYSSSCPLESISAPGFDFRFWSDPIFMIFSTSISLVNCSASLMTSVLSSITVVGPIECLSGSGYFVYVMKESETENVIANGCHLVSELDFPTRHGMWKQDLDNFVNNREVYYSWYQENISNCQTCETEGKLCGVDWDQNQTICYGYPKNAKGLSVPMKIITGTATVIAFVILVTILAVVYFHVTKQSKKEKETRLKVERFLATYKTTKPTRYSYSDIWKVTKAFKQKLGQGGFGSVYKGELSNGIPIAVKMLEKSKGEADEFINEVAIMGRIHHVNVVSLLGFFSEGTRQALIYEYMPNKSLEKIIFSKNARVSMEKLQNIAIGIAHGIEYLHQGCDQQILHFDIKPHNILLDHDLNPKISDFGLSKLCSRDQSIVTMTAARGTMGYIAPEIYSRNFGNVSCKSDVYSFGMLLLEMVSGRRNVDPETESSNEVYFPEWIYDRLIHGEDLGLTNVEGEDKDIAKKLVIVALWCIQWSPNDRPAMTRVIQMLIGDSESMQIPPKPFVSASDQDGN